MGEPYEPRTFMALATAATRLSMAEEEMQRQYGSSGPGHLTFGPVEVFFEGNIKVATLIGDEFGGFGVQLEEDGEE